ncbi:hypothetical protein AA313_de0206062 [Arthrobotrys entomopaga]|nr:hypothetical protein AA313_de0206062 [Arthrobotrys entomopaga]
MTTAPFSAVAGVQEPFVTPQKRYSAISLAHSTTSTTSDKADALRAATLSFSPPFTRPSTDEASSVSASPPKTNGTALIAARAIGTGNSSPRSLPQPDRRGSLSRNSSFDLASSSSPAHAGSLKAARLSVIGTPTSSSTVSRARSVADLNSSFPVRIERTYSEDASFISEGSLIAAKLSAAKRDSPTPTIHISNRNEMMQPPSLLAAGLAVSRSTTPAMLSSAQPERDQEPDILPPAGSVSEAKKRLLQQTDASEEVTIRGRRSLEGPMRSKNPGTFHDSPPQSTLNISPLSAAKLAVQHSGRSAGASSAGPGPKAPKPRQPSPIKKEFRRDSDSEAVPTSSAPVAPSPKPAMLKKPTLQNIKITKTAVAPLSVNVEAKGTPASPKPAPKPVALKKIVTQVTGTPPPQPIKPLPRKTRPPTRTRSFKALVPDAPSLTLDNSKSSKPVVRAQAPPTPEEYVDKTAPPLPLPRRTITVAPPPKPTEPPTPPVEPPTPVRRDPRLMGFTSVKLPPPPPVVDERPLEPVKQLPIVASSIEPKKQGLPILPPKPKPVEPTTTILELPLRKPKPEPLKPKTYVDSIVSRQPTSLYGMKERSGSAATLSPESMVQASTSTIFKQPAPAKSANALRPSFTGPDSTKPSHRRPSLNWREDLPYSFHGSEDYIRPSHTGEHHHARLASSLASSRAGSPVKSNPIPLPPRTSPGLRTTMRSPDKPGDRDGSPPKKSHNILGKKHPNKHNEGARKRWREFVTEKERKRYEGLWAANRGLYLTEKMFDGIPDAKGRKLHLEAVCAVVVKDLWSRSRLPLDILEQIWDLVDRGPRPKFWLTRDEFIMGLWLIDQSLKGRKLPGKVQDGTWESVRRMGVVLKGYNELGLKKKEVKTR